MNTLTPFRTALHTGADDASRSLQLTDDEILRLIEYLVTDKAPAADPLLARLAQLYRTVYREPVALAVRGV